MKTQLISRIFLGLMALAFCKTGIETLADPQSVMNNVGIILNNSSAESSMRAVYGGMHVVFGLFCVYGIFASTGAALTLVALYTAGFTIGRVSGVLVNGAPNEFVMMWMITEVICGIIAGFLLFRYYARQGVAAV